MRSLTVLTLLAALAGAACSQPLGGMGRASSEWVRGEEEPAPMPEAMEEGPPTPLHPVSEAEWVNDALGAGGGSPAVVLGRVLARADEGEAFVQASRREIAAALPGVRFPSLVPAEVEHVTSQLVLDPEAGTLDEGTVAAFGMWTVRPYSVSHTIGRRSVLTVGRMGEEAEGSDRCPAPDPAACQSVPIGEGAAWVVVGEARHTVVWSEGPYRYELVCHEPVDRASCLRMAGSSSPLEELGQELGP